MIRMKRATEYALLSIAYMSSKQGSDQVSTAREIADRYGLPFEITAKTLQKLKSTGLVKSLQGVQGGYVLDRDLETLDLREFLNLLEGETNLVECVSDGRSMDCAFEEKCGIQPHMKKLQSKISSFLGTIRIGELIESRESR